MFELRALLFLPRARHAQGRQVCAAALAALFALSVAPYGEARAAELLPTGQTITPEAATGAHFQNLNPGLAAFPDHLAGQAVTTAVSHDGKTLLILTSGFNRMAGPDGKADPGASNEYVFVFDISGATPRQVQVVQVPNTDSGIVFAPDDSRFFVSGGVDDDVHVFVRGSPSTAASAFALRATADKSPRSPSPMLRTGEETRAIWTEAGAPIALGHAKGLGIDVQPSAAGLDVSEDGTVLVVANRMNDSISVVDVAAAKVTGELDLRPGRSDRTKAGVPGGEYPYWVQISGGTAYISCQRDREIDVVDLAGLRVIGRVKVTGTPNRILLNRDKSLLYVAEDNSDAIEIISTVSGMLVGSIDARAPARTLSDPRAFRGAAPNSLALAPDGGTLYATLGGSNAVAVIPLTAATRRVAALVPTGWYPNSVSAAGNMLYVVNGRSNVGPNPLACANHQLDKSRAAICRDRKSTR